VLLDQALRDALGHVGEQLVPARIGAGSVLKFI
jgi:hypothetical protein